MFIVCVRSNEFIWNYKEYQAVELRTQFPVFLIIDIPILANYIRDTHS